MINGDGAPHDLAIPDLKIQTSLLLEKDKSSQVVFQAEEAGDFIYYCTVSGHRQVGMEGRFIVNSALARTDSNGG
jgi:nitrite reductase (NO-forming)